MTAMETKGDFNAQMLQSLGEKVTALELSVFRDLGFEFDHLGSSSMILKVCGVYTKTFG
jgi:hypothetical protein